MKEIVKAEKNELATQNIMSIIEKVAFSTDADVEKLSKMLEMQERYEAKEARKSFFKSLSMFQSEMPPVIKSKAGHNYQYAPLCDITAIANPVLNKFGLAYRFEQSQQGQDITVTCIISNFDGHEERTSMTAPIDTSGSKNAVQASGSTVQYLMRYTFIGSLGITTADSDSDGRVLAQTGDFIGDSQLAELESLIDEVSANKEMFLNFYKISELKDLPMSLYPKALQTLNSKRKQS